MAEDAAVSAERLNVLYWANAGVALEDISTASMLEDEYRNRCAEVSKLEMFMHSLPDPSSLADFVNLRELSLHVQTIPKPVGLSRMASLQRLCITDVGLETMAGIEQCTQLMHLDLSSNQLPEMEMGVLSCLTNLRTLWLSQNRIRVIQGVAPLQRLNALWLARNQISEIGDALDDNAALTELNLASSDIGNFKDIPNLVRLRLLSTLALSDAHFGDSPVVSLCNYQTYILFHLPQLNILDGCIIADEARQLAEATYMKKKMYYNMRIKTLKRNTTNVVRKATEARQAKVSQLNLNLNVLLRQRKDVERELHLRRRGGAAADDDEGRQLEHKLSVLERAIGLKAAEIARTDALAAEVREAVCHASHASVCRLMVELETGGNIRLEEGGPTDVWFSSCVELLHSRFVAADFAAVGVHALRVTRVCRLHNRQLRNRFEERVEAMVGPTDASYKRSLEYLFFSEHPALPGELTRVLEEGFGPADAYADAHADAAVPLSNSLSLCELDRLRATVGGHAGPSGSGVRLTSKLLIAKVFLAKCALEKSSEAGGGGSSSGGGSGGGGGGGGCSVRAVDYPGCTSVYRPSAVDPKQRRWLVFEPALVLPEYLVELEYVRTGCTADRDPSPRQLLELAGMSGARSASAAEAADLASLTRPLARFAQQCTLAASADPYDEVCTAALNLPPALASRAKAEAITPELLEAEAGPEGVAAAEVINLHGHCIRKLEGLERLAGLRVLVLGFNEIHKMEGLEALVGLQRLELGFNLIKRIEGLKGLLQLHTLELNNNLIYRLDDAGVLRLELPALRDLNLQNNAVCELKSYRPHVLRRLPRLERLDGVGVDQEERERAAEVSTAITPELIMAHASARRRWSYSLGPVPGGGAKPAASPPRRAEATGGHGSQAAGEGWWAEVQELELNHQQLRRLTELDRLPNLRRGSFCSNELTRIEGLDRCVQLEEISLEDNRIQKLENLSSLQMLTKLDLGKNKISRIEGLESLTKLTQLSLEDNDIGSLAGLALVSGLMELYIGNNRVSGLAEVQQLRGLGKLIILDLSGNPLCESPEYRQYTVYQLRKLKVLDGVGIDATEQAEAREIYAGKLTAETLVERLGHNYWEHVHELDLCRSKIRELDALHAPGFCNLRELNLDSNVIVEVHSLPYLPALTTLRLNHNLIQATSVPEQRPGSSEAPVGLSSLTALELLQLGYNQIAELPPLQLHTLPALRVLHLQGNELTRVEGLANLPNLRELVLDRNRIRQLEPASLSSLPALRELRIEENGLRSLDNFSPLPQLQTLVLSSNRISDLSEIEKLDSLLRIAQIALSNNPVARKPLYRPTLVRKLPTLKLIDAREVTPEERERAELMLNGEARGVVLQDSRVPAAKVPLKLTSMNFELMSGLSLGGAVAQTGNALPHTGSALPHSAAGLNSGFSVGASGEWRSARAPLNDEVLMPHTRQLRPAEDVQGRSRPRATSRLYEYGHR